MSVETYETHGPSMGKYVIGFVLSVILTLLAFGAVMLGWLDGWSLNLKVAYFVGLAIIQIAVQMIFFLHLGEGPDAKWNITAVWFIVFCVFVIIYGTWWTMQHLNYQVMGSNGRVVIVNQTRQLRSVSVQDEQGTNLSEETATAPADSVPAQEIDFNEETAAIPGDSAPAQETNLDEETAAVPEDSIPAQEMNLDEETAAVPEDSAPAQETNLDEETAAVPEDSAPAQETNLDEETAAVPEDSAPAQEMNLDEETTAAPEDNVSAQETDLNEEATTAPADIIPAQEEDLNE